MEKQQIVEKSVYTALNGEVETNIFTSQYNKEIDNLQTLKTKVFYRGTKETIDKATFLSAVSNEAGAYVFAYDKDSNSWFARFLGGEPVDLATYGITIEGTPENLDTIYVLVADSQVYAYGYAEAITLFASNDNTFNFVSFVSDKEVSFAIENGERRIVDIQDTSTKKVELDFREPQSISITIWNGTKEDVETNLILAKKVAE